MFETKYSGKTPKKYGEQHGASFAPDRAAPEYQQVSSSDRYPNKSKDSGRGTHKSTHKNRNPWLNGGGMRQVSATYRKKIHSMFSSEKCRNTLISPTSRPPKKA